MSARSSHSRSLIGATQTCVLTSEPQIFLWLNPRTLQIRPLFGNRSSVGKRIRHFIRPPASRWSRRPSVTLRSQRWRRIINHTATPYSLSTSMPPPDRLGGSLVNSTCQTAGTNYTISDGTPAVPPFAPTRLIRIWKDATLSYREYAHRAFSS